MFTLNYEGSAPAATAAILSAATAIIAVVAEKQKNDGKPNPCASAIAEKVTHTHFELPPFPFAYSSIWAA